MKLATLCYIRRGKKTLMLYRTKKEHHPQFKKWNGLGGKLELNESPEECVIREIKEEAGLTLKKPKLKGIITFPDNMGTGDVWYAFVYVADKFSGTPVKENEDGILEWVDSDKIIDLKLQPADKIFIKWLDKPGVFSAKFDLNYETGEIYDYSVEFY